MPATEPGSTPQPADAPKPTASDAIVATGLMKWFGEGETKVTAVNGASLVEAAKHSEDAAGLTNDSVILYEFWID